MSLEKIFKGNAEAMKLVAIYAATGSAGYCIESQSIIHVPMYFASLGFCLESFCGSGDKDYEKIREEIREEFVRVFGKIYVAAILGLASGATLRTITG